MRLLFALFVFGCNVLIAKECSTPEVNALEVSEIRERSVLVRINYCLSSIDDDIMIYSILADTNTEIYNEFSPHKLDIDSNSIEIEVIRPIKNFEAFTSKSIGVALFLPGENPFYKKSFPLRIDWDEIALNKDDGMLLIELVDSATSLVDQGGKALKLAKFIIDKVIDAEPNNQDIYIELARYYMKSKPFGVKSEGVLMAEQVLKSSIQINDQHANTHVLLGYVYVWTEQFELALKHFQMATKLGTENTWLYTNWGQMYDKQGDLKNAIHYYEIAASTELRGVSSDRAIWMAADYLHPIYLKNNEYKKALDLAESTYSKFPSRSCFKASALEVKALYLDLYQEVIAEIENSSDLGCKKILNHVKSLGYLRLWAKESNESTEAIKYYIKALTINSDYVDLVSSVSHYKFSDEVLPKLAKKQGLEVRDANDFTALAKAISTGNVNSVRRLIDAGADVNVIVTPQKLSLLFLGVLSKNTEILALLMEKGVDVQHKSFQGITALDLARYYGLSEVIELLETNKNI